MTIDGKECIFLRDDGSPAEGAVYTGGEDPDGEVLFFELVGQVHPKLNGSEKYRRLLIRRVFPYLMQDQE